MLQVSSHCLDEYTRYMGLTVYMIVADISRVAAAVQVITKEGNTIYGKLSIALKEESWS